MMNYEDKSKQKKYISKDVFCLISIQTVAGCPQCVAESCPRCTRGRVAPSRGSHHSLSGCELHVRSEPDVSARSHSLVTGH